MATYNVNQLIDLFNAISRDPVEKNLVEKACAKRGSIKIGSNIQLYDRQTDNITNITLCKPGDADPTVGRISCCSMLGKKLLGASVGETVKITFFNRTMMFEVISSSQAAAPRGGD